MRRLPIALLAHASDVGDLPLDVVLPDPLQLALVLLVHLEPVHAHDDAGTGSIACWIRKAASWISSW